MRYLTDREQANRAGRGSKGLWRYGKRHGSATCPVCLRRMSPGEWVKAAAGHAGTVKHVACPAGGRA